MKFTNEGLPNGLPRAVYMESGEEYKRRLCYIDGRKCFVGDTGLAVS